MQFHLASHRSALAWALLFLISVFSSAQATPEKRRVSLAELPIQFEPNFGQAEKGVDFLAHLPQLDVALRAQEVSLRMADGISQSTNLTVRFANSSKLAYPAGSDLRTSQTHYLLGRDPSRWHTHVPNFGRVTYTDLYPGIDAVFYGTGQRLEHDFVVRPGADYRAIRMHLLGSEGLALQSDGRLRIRLAKADLFFDKPQVYQTINGARRDVSGSFAIIGGDELTFQIGKYDPSKVLVIDPVLTYSTFLANLSIEVSAMAADASGNTYVTGATSSSSFPVTAGVFQGTCKSCPNGNDVYISKLSADGTTLVYSTFLGGSNGNGSSGIAVDGNGNAIVVGSTQSTDFPVKNSISYGTAALGTVYGFITSLSADGSSLNYSSLLGGGAQPGQSTGTGAGVITLDGSGNAYIAGGTNSPIFPVTTGAVNVGTPGYPATTVFMMKFAPSGTLLYSSLPGVCSPPPSVGGEGPIGVSGIAIDQNGDAFLTGNAGTLWPTTTGAYQTTIPGSSPFSATFVTELSASASQLVYSTFIGSGEAASGIAVDSSGEAIAVGMRAPSNFPTTSNAYEPTIPANGCCPAYLSKLSADGSQLLYSTFFYGNLMAQPTTNIWGVALDSAGDIWIDGDTSDPQLAMVQPLEAVPGPLTYPIGTGFIAEFDPTGTTLNFSTYFGGLNGGGVAPTGPVVDGQGNVHIAGTANYELYTSPGVYLGTVAANPDYAYGFMAVIAPRTASPAMCVSYPANQGVGLGSIPAGSSTNQTLQIQNCGTSPLSTSGFVSSLPVFTIPTSLNGCTQQLAVNASCTLTVTFTPATFNTPYNGTLTVSANTSMPLIMPLFGMGIASWGLVAPGNSGTATVTAGQTATYNVSIGGEGLGGTATLTCGGAPANAVCSVPPTVTVSASTAAPLTVTVTTTARPSSGLPIPSSPMPWLWALGIFGIFALAISLSRRRVQLLPVGTVAAILALTLLLSCARNSGSNGGGTPPGTYSLTVTATGASAEQQLFLTLNVN